jgi:hypothetical protein
MARRLRTPPWLLRSGGGGASSVDIAGTPSQAAQIGAGTITNPVDVAGTPSQAAQTGSGTLTNPVNVAGTPSQAANTGSGTLTNPIDLAGTPSQGAQTGEGEVFGGDVDLEGAVTQGAQTGSGALDTGASEGLPRGGFLPDDYDEREKRRKAIRATLEGVARPKPAQVAQVMREAVAPAAEPPAATLRDAVSPATMEGLRRLAETAQARHAALDDDDEEVLMLLGV